MNPEELQKTSELIQAGKLDDAERLCREVLRTAPKQFQALYLLGFTQMRKKEFDSAEKTIGEAIQLNASMPDAHYNRGCALQELGRDADALASFERALLLNPHYLHAEFNRATSLLRLRRLEEAEMAFANLIQKTPQDAEVWHNRGDALFGMSRTMDAIACFEQALMLAPKSLRTLELHATAFIRLRDFETASIDYEKIVAMGPQHEYAQGNLLYTRLNCCDWRNLEIQKKNVEAGVKAGKSIINPFVYVLVSQTPAAQRSCAEIWHKKNFSKLPEPLGGEERYGHKKIRLAYVSGDFRNHAVARLMAGIIESHDRERFEIYGIALGVDDDSAMRQRLKSAFDHFQVVNAMTDNEAAIWMREHEIDIAVDLMICTGDCRPGIFANRAAPIQVNYLGFAGTSGSYYLDYILADAVVIPDEDKPHYSEKVVYLPNTFQPNDSRRKAAEAIPTRAMEGLPDTGFVFCSFNNSCKILPEIFDIWMRILRGVEGSVLWLPKHNTAEETNLRREAAARGIVPERIIFAELTPTPEEYLSRLPLADLFLDTLPYNAHTTASDALWMGVPVLTRLGTTHVGRVAASVLTAIGLTELVTHSAVAYEKKALELAKNPAALEAIREKLIANRQNAPLFDTVRHCRNLEAAYAVMHERHENGEPPTPFTVSE